MDFGLADRRALVLASTRGLGRAIGGQTSFEVLMPPCVVRALVT